MKGKLSLLLCFILLISTFVSSSVYNITADLLNPKTSSAVDKPLNNKAETGVAGIRMKTAPSKTTYYYGEALNLTGAVITETYSNGNTRDFTLTESMIRGYNSKYFGSQSVTVFYRGFTTTFDVTVSGQINLPITEAQIKATLNGINLTIAVNNQSVNYNYQFWSFQKVSKDILALNNQVLYNWVNVSNFSAKRSATFSALDAADADGNYQIMVRVQKTNGQFVGQFIVTITQIQAGFVGIDTVTIQGKVTNGTEYFKNTDGPLLIKINAVNATNYSMYGCVATEGKNGEFTLDISGYAPGRYTITAQANGADTKAQKQIAINIYQVNANESYPVVSGINTHAGEKTNKIAVDINVELTPGTQYMYILSEPNRPALTSSNGYINSSSSTFTLGTKQYGHYLIIAYAKRSSAATYDDGILSYYNYERPGGAASVDAVLTGSKDFNNMTLGETVKLTATANIKGLEAGETLQYSFWRSDANGFTLFKDWAGGEGTNILTWKPAMAGKYSIQVRAKGSNSGSYEAVNNYNFTVDSSNLSSLKESDITIKFYDIETGTEIIGNLPARTPVEIRAVVPEGNDLYYKYIVYDTQLGGYQISSYSVDNKVVWVPRKAMSFKVSLFARSFNSFGSADVVKTVEVTAQ